MSDLNQEELRAAAERRRQHNACCSGPASPYQGEQYELYFLDTYRLADAYLSRLDADAKQPEEDARPVDAEEAARELGFQGPEGSTLKRAGTLTWFMCDTKTGREPLLCVGDSYVHNPTVGQVRKLIEALEGE